MMKAATYVRVSSKNQDSSDWERERLDLRHCLKEVYIVCPSKEWLGNDGRGATRGL